MSDKKKFNETKFGAFIAKAGKSLPEILTVGGEILTGDLGGAVEKVGDILKGKSERSTEAAKLLQEYNLAKMDFEKEIYALEVEDRNSARSREVELAKAGGADWMMYVTGLAGLAAFFIVVYAVIWMPETQDNDLFIHLLGMIEGVVVSNIFAYYFGTSKSSKDKDLIK
jgi:hypothetical protein